LSELNTKFLQETLRSYIAQLPEYLRNVLTLRDLAELSYAEIGKILGITAGTARVYRCKAIQLLSVWMRKEE
jgi:RNA polymerase sigma factor (sigma-70 family)